MFDSWSLKKVVKSRYRKREAKGARMSSMGVSGCP
jgi:hypothetical protein